MNVELPSAKIKVFHTDDAASKFCRDTRNVLDHF